MARSTAIDKYFEALTESYDAIIEAIKAGNGRGYRIASHLLTEAQHGQHDMLELGRRFASQPADIRGLYRATTESATRSRERARAFGGQLLDEFAAARMETRNTIDRVVKAQRAAGDATVAATRDVASVTIERVRAGISRGTGRTTGNGAAEEPKGPAPELGEAKRDARKDGSGAASRSRQPSVDHSRTPARTGSTAPPATSTAERASDVPARRRPRRRGKGAAP